MNKQLNFAEKPVQVLTLDELEKSYHENLPTGDPVGGIYHFALIQQVLALFENRGLKPVVQEIFAAANRDSKRPGVTILPQLEEKFGEKAIEAHLLRRVYANIEIRCDETDELVTCLAVAYHQKGIQLGIGPSFGYGILGTSGGNVYHGWYFGAGVNVSLGVTYKLLEF
jgi:hypothetical protein